MSIITDTFEFAKTIKIMPGAKRKIQKLLDICYSIDNLFFNTSWGKHNNYFGFERDKQLRLGKIFESDLKSLINDVFDINTSFQSSSTVEEILEESWKYYKLRRDEFMTMQNKELLKKRDELAKQLKDIEDKLANGDDENDRN